MYEYEIIFSHLKQIISSILQISFGTSFKTCLPVILFENASQLRRNTTSNIQKTPQLKFLAILAVATSVILVFTITSWNMLPTLVIEDVTVIAVTDYGCVAESSMGHSVVVPDCSASGGDVVSTTFYVPAMDQNGYYDRIQDKIKMANP